MWNLDYRLEELRTLEIQERLDEREKKMAQRTQTVESNEDFELLRRGEDLLEVSRTKYPKCASECFLYIAVGKKNLILWDTGLGSRVNEIYGRVIKLPLNDISFGQPLKVPNYGCNKFFELNEKTFTKLHDAGLIW